MRTIFLIAAVFCTSVCSLAQSSAEREIRTMLARQVEEWNKGNIEGYMVGYWDNDSLVFIGKNGPTYGYRPTLERYKKGYPDVAAMGKLTSTILSIRELCPEYYFILGKWELKRTAGDLSGSYTLLVKKINGKWMIICDHSS